MTGTGTAPGPTTRSASSSSRSSSAGSAQWMSSITATTGDRRRERGEERPPRARAIFSCTSRGLAAPRTRRAGSSTPTRVGERGRRSVRGRRRRPGVSRSRPMRPDPFQGDVRRVGVEDARVPLQDLRQRPVGDAVAVRAGIDPARRRARGSSRSDQPTELARRAGSCRRRGRRRSSPGAAGPPRPTAGTSSGGLELAVAPDHRRAQAGDAALGAQAASSSSRTAATGSLLAPELSIAESPNRNPRAARAVRSATTICPGRRACSRRAADVHGVAGDHRLTGPGVRGGEHLAGVHAGADLQRHAEPALGDPR